MDTQSNSNFLVPPKLLSLIEEAHSLQRDDNDHIRNFFLNKDPVIRFTQLIDY